MLLHEHPLLPDLLPYITVKHSPTRALQARFELRHVPSALRLRALAVVADCPACGTEIRPFRLRRGSGRDSIYLALTCPDEVNLACSRGEPARAYRRTMEQVVRGAPVPSAQARLV